jgi:hypothetical protein
MRLAKFCPTHILPELLFIVFHHIRALQIDLAAIFFNVARQQAEDGLGKRTLSTSRFPEDHNGAIRIQLKVDAIHCLHSTGAGFEM